jgi:hypothetical protein
MSILEGQLARPEPRTKQGAVDGLCGAPMRGQATDPRARGFASPGEARVP